MKKILELDQHELGYTHSHDREIDYHREAARCVLRDHDGRVALMYFARDGFYKLPGGVVDPGESIRDALVREVREEAGIEISDIVDLGIVEENRCYCGMHQTSYCYQVIAGAEIGTARTDEEQAAGMELRWIDDIETALALIESSEGRDEEGDGIGLMMMKLREARLLQECMACQS